MKITIDTKEDSKDDIKRVIALLSQVADNSSGFESSSGQRNFDMFSDNSSSVTSSPSSNAPSQSPPSSLGVFSMFDDSTPSRSTISDNGSPTIIKEDQSKTDAYEGNVEQDDFKIIPY